MHREGARARGALRRSCYTNRQVNIYVKDRGRAQRRLVSQVQIQLKITVAMIISTSGRESSVRRYRNLINRLGLSGKVQYSSFVSEKVDETHAFPQEFVDIIREKNCPCLGGAISKDTKGEIIPFLDSLDDSACAVDFVTTVLNEAGHLKI